MMQAICIPCLAGRTSAGVGRDSYALPPFKPGILGVRGRSDLQERGI